MATDKRLFDLERAINPPDQAGAIRVIWPDPETGELTTTAGPYAPAPNDHIIRLGIDLSKV